MKKIPKILTALNMAVLLLLCGISFLQAQEIAITFDDAPRPSTQLFTGEERTKKLIENLEKAGVFGVVFFITAKDINENSQKRLKSYINAGHFIGNHSFRHNSISELGIEEYLEDISRADEVLKKFDNFLPLFRYPFLHEGQDRQTRDAIRLHLKKLGYQNGYVTVDNYEWYMDALLQRAIKEGKQVDFQKLGRLYVESLWESITFYDTIAKKTLGRSPKHILLLHENDISTLFIGDLIKHLRAQGWSIISAKEAYSDPISSIIPDVLFNGQGRVAAIARSQGFESRKLVHESEDEAFLEAMFKARGIYK